MRAWSRVLGLGLAVQAALGCGDSAKEETKSDNGGSSTGGTGGTQATGGSISSGGSGRTMGGTGATGGSNTGGAGATGGSNIGGAGATGGSNIGGAGATGGSNIGGAGATGGSNIGGRGAAGGSNTGGAGATGGSSSGGGGGGLPENPLCEPFARHVAAECPNAWTYEDGISYCNDAYESEYAMGCGAGWDTFVVCRTGAEVNCDNSRPIGCDASEESLAECVRDFNTRTGCLQMNAGGRMCPAG